MVHNNAYAGAQQRGTFGAKNKHITKKLPQGGRVTAKPSPLNYLSGGGFSFTVVFAIMYLI